MTPVVIIAILCITVLEVFALVYGVDGALFGIGIAAISGLGGYQIHKQLAKKQQK